VAGGILAGLGSLVGMDGGGKAFLAELGGLDGMDSERAAFLAELGSLVDMQADRPFFEENAGCLPLFYQKFTFPRLCQKVCKTPSERPFCLHLAFANVVQKPDSRYFTRLRFYSQPLYGQGSVITTATSPEGCPLYGTANDFKLRSG
jgi:hypothetical protein